MTAFRSYTLEIPATGARIVRSGPANPLAVGIGKPASAAPGIAALLFPLCPEAHRAAAARAILAVATGDHPSPEERNRTVLAEALIASVFRVAIVWPRLAGISRAPHIVRALRETVGGLGNHSAPDLAALIAEARNVAHASLDVLAEEADAISLAEVAPLASRIEDPVIHPERSCRSETVKNIRHPCTVLGLFAAQVGLIEILLSRLLLTSEADAAGDEMSTSCDGRGIGVAVTARGRLRHVIDIEDGRIVGWRADAPSDWNFAPRGPVSLTAASLPASPARKRQAELLIAAFDPCAPCTVSETEALVHA